MITQKSYFTFTHLSWIWNEKYLRGDLRRDLKERVKKRRRFNKLHLGPPSDSCLSLIANPVPCVSFFLPSLSSSRETCFSKKIKWRNWDNSLLSIIDCFHSFLSVPSICSFLFLCFFIDYSLSLLSLFLKYISLDFVSFKRNRFVSVMHQERNKTSLRQMLGTKIY